MALGTPYTVVSDSVQISSGTTRQATITANVVAGDAVTVVCFNNIGVAVSSVTDSQGNTYTQAVAPSTGNLFRTTVYVALNCAAMTSGSDWIKMTFGSVGSTCQVGMIARGCSGVATASAVDTAGTPAANTGTGTTASVTGATTLAQASEWLVSCAQASNASTGLGACG